jgi:hypothetical protein
VLLNIDEHVLIFNAWADAGQTQYWAYEHPQTIYHVVAYPYLPGYGTYLPYRLNGMSQMQSDNATNGTKELWPVCGALAAHNRFPQQATAGLGRKNFNCKFQPQGELGP